MSDSIKDFEVTVQVRNNQVKARRLALGLSQREFARYCGLAASTVSAMERCSIDALLKDGTWSKSVVKVALALKVPPDTLFPEVVRLVKKNTVTLTADGEQVLALVAQAQRELESQTDRPLALLERNNTIAEVLETLTPREQKIIRQRFGMNEDGEEYTLQEISELDGCGKERIRQIEAQALRKLRHPARAKHLMPIFMEEGQRGWEYLGNNVRSDVRCECGRFMVIIREFRRTEYLTPRGHKEIPCRDLYCTNCCMVLEEQPMPDKPEVNAVPYEPRFWE